MAEQTTVPHRKRQAGPPARPVGIGTIGESIFPDAARSPRSFGFIRRDESNRSTTWTEVHR